EDDGEAWYPGSIERFAFGEEREDKGGNLVEIVPESDGHWRPVVTFAPTPARRFVTHTVDELIASAIPDDAGTTAHRIKGDVAPAALAALRARLSGVSLRHLKLDLNVRRAQKVRDPELREALTDEALLRRRLETRGIESD